MRARASTDDDGLRWKHAVWNGIPCSSFLILRCCSSHFRSIQSLLQSQGGACPHRRSLSTQSHLLACHAERSEESLQAARRFFAALSMTGAKASDLLSERLCGLPPFWHLHPHTIFGEGATDVTAIYTWNRRRISNGGSSNGSVVFTYSDDAGEGGGAVRR